MPFTKHPCVSGAIILSSYIKVTTLCYPMYLLVNAQCLVPEIVYIVVAIILKSRVCVNSAKTVIGYINLNPDANLVLKLITR